MRSGFSVLMMVLIWSGLFDSALAQQRTAVGPTFDALLQMMEIKCAEIGDLQAEKLEQEGKKADAFAMRSARKTICVCFPGKIRELKATLSPEKLAEQLTEDEIQTIYMMRIIGHCGAVQMVETYAGDCATRLGVVTKLPPKYCSCMQTGFNEFSDVELAQLGLDNADWTPRAAEAQKRGDLLPEKTPLLKRLEAVESACRGS